MLFWEVKMSDCIFCKIVSGEIPTELVYENTHVVAFRDLNPQAPHHYLIIPRQHVDSIRELEDQAVMGSIMNGARELAQQEGIKEYRLVINAGEGAGQTVFHLHMHLMGGRGFSWPPG